MTLSIKKIGLSLMVGLLISNASIQAQNPITAVKNAPQLIEKAMNSGKEFVHGLIPGKWATGIAVGSSAMYFVYVKMIQKDWMPIIKDARKYTKFLIDSTGAPGDKLMYWNIHEIKFPQDYNTKTIYAKFYADKKHQDETEDMFIDRMIKEIAKEKDELLKMLQKLNKCLEACEIVPSWLKTFKISTKIELDTVVEIIETEKKRLHIESKQLHELDIEEFEAIKQEIEKKGTVSLINPFRLSRHWLFPFEAKAVNENWSIRLLIARLEILESALTSKRNELNKTV